MLLFTNEEVLINYGVSYLRIAGFSYLLALILNDGKRMEFDRTSTTLRTKVIKGKINNNINTTNNQK